LVVKHQIEVAEGVVKVDTNAVASFTDAGGGELEPVSVGSGVDGEAAKGDSTLDGFEVVGFALGVVGGGFCPVAGGV
jgi:hypothetical protein